MAKHSLRAQLILDGAKLTELEKMASSRTAPLREVQRAKIMIAFSRNIPITQIEKEIGVSRPTIYKCIDKALSMGTDAGLRDRFHRPKQPVITEEAKMWVVKLACTKPQSHGYASEIWSRKLLASHARAYGSKEGHPPCLVNATIQRILDKHPIRPHKIAYYLERRDPDFERKMQDILVVYKEVNLTNETMKDGELPDVITISIDEKPGVQAIQNIAPEILPNPQTNSRLLRDHEYKRLGIVSILAALDLHTGYRD